jgi:hypothetical protein
MCVWSVPRKSGKAIPNFLPTGFKRRARHRRVDI